MGTTTYTDGQSITANEVVTDGNTTIIDTDATVTVSANIYIEVQSGGTLTIRAGSTLKFSAGNGYIY